nr:hypothetical protein [Tanacetum cinerariifolium]
SDPISYGNKTKNNVKKSNLSPLNLENALDDDNEGGDDVMILGSQFIGADNCPPMLEKDMYDSWKSIMELYMLNRPHGRMIL